MGLYRWLHQGVAALIAAPLDEVEPQRQAAAAIYGTAAEAAEQIERCCG